MAPRRPSPARLGILRAMLSRRAPLLRGDRQWFVRGWAPTVYAEDVEALLRDGWVAPPPEAPRRGTPRVLVLTEGGHRLALEEAARARPPTRAEEIAA